MADRDDIVGRLMTDDDDHTAYARYTTILLMKQQAELAKLNKAILRKNAKIARARQQGRRDAAGICDATATEIAEKGLGADNPDTFLAGAGYALARAAQAIEARATRKVE